MRKKTKNNLYKAFLSSMLTLLLFSVTLSVPNDTTTQNNESKVSTCSDDLKYDKRN